MVTLKITRSVSQRHASATATELNKAQSLPPIIENGLVLMTSQCTLVQEDLSPPRIELGIFQALLFFKPMQPFCQGQPSQQSPSQLLMSRHKMISNIKQLQANLDTQGALIRVSKSPSHKRRKVSVLPRLILEG